MAPRPDNYHKQSSVNGSMSVGSSSNTEKDGQISDIASGTAKYMSLYPKDSTDGVIRLGNIVPDFNCHTTQGYWPSFHAWKKGY